MQKFLYKKEIPFLSVIRCFSTFQIVLFHLICEVPFSNEYVLLWGREGVGLFFAISGAGLINRYYHDWNYKKFFRKRFIGIYIPFWIAYFAVFVWKYFWNHFTWNNGVPFINFILSVLGIDGFVANFGVPTFYLIGEWYLGVLLFLYLLFPLWRKLFLKSPHVTVGVFLVLRILISIKNPFMYIPVCFNPITALSNFSFGAYVIYLMSKNNKPEMQKYLFRSKTVFLCSLFLICIGSYLGHKYNYQDFGEIFATVGLLFFYIIITPKVNHVLGKCIGKVCFVSYEVFLIHHVIIYAMAPVISANYSYVHLILGGIIIVSTIFLLAALLKNVCLKLEQSVR